MPGSVVVHTQQQGNLGLGPKIAPWVNLAAVALVFMFYRADRAEMIELIKDTIANNRLENAKNAAAMDVQRAETGKLSAGVSDLASQVRENNIQSQRVIALAEAMNRRAERVIERFEKAEGIDDRGSRPHIRPLVLPGVFAAMNPEKAPPPRKVP